MKPVLVGMFLMPVAILLIIVAFLGTEKTEDTDIVSSLDPSDHPVYSKYEFGEGDNVIDFGIQPLEIPPGIISEAMRRDATLRDSLSQLGLEIKFHPFLKGADINFFLKRGDVEAVMAGDMPTLTASATHDVIVVSLTKQGFNSIVAREQMLLTALRGRRIGYAFSSNAHYSLLEALADAGLGENDVHLVPMDVTQMPDALAAREVDAFSAWEPMPAIAIARPDGFVAIHRTLSTSYMYFARLFAEKHPEAVCNIVASQPRSMAWMRQSKRNFLVACGWTL